MSKTESVAPSCNAFYVKSDNKKSTTIKNFAYLKNIFNFVNYIIDYIHHDYEEIPKTSIYFGYLSNDNNRMWL